MVARPVDTNIKTPQFRRSFVLFEILILLQDKEIYSHNSSWLTNGSKSMRSDTSQPKPTDHDEVVLRLNEIARHSKNLAGDLLVLLNDACFWMSIASKYPNLVGDPFAGEIIMEIEGCRERKRVREAVKRIKKRKLVRDKKQGKVILHKMTNVGEIQLIDYRIRLKESLLPDGEYCLVTFDIPENTKVTRQYFRKKLRQFGFKQHHLSVWISNHDVVDEMNTYVRMLKATKWVTVFRAEMK